MSELIADSERRKMLAVHLDGARVLMRLASIDLVDAADREAASASRVGDHG